jgi:hypothetical protein
LYATIAENPPINDGISLPVSDRLRQLSKKINLQIINRGGINNYQAYINERLIRDNHMFADISRYYQADSSLRTLANVAITQTYL